MKKHSKIYVAGHRGMVGSSILRRLRKEGFENLIFRASNEVDLTCQEEVVRFFMSEQPEYVFLAAARVGGIMANNSYRAEFIYSNLQIQSNVIHSSWKVGVKKLLFLSSSCVYPRICPQPMKEEYLLSGPLEPTNEPYAMAKLAGMSMCRAYNDQYGTDFISVIPTNLYGPNDNYDLQQSHLMAALILKFHVAKMSGTPWVTLWGTGSPRRELMYVDDAADAALFMMQNYTGDMPINAGLGEDRTVQELAAVVGKLIGYEGEILFDRSKPDGVSQKLLDVSRSRALGWKAQMELEEGIAKAYEWYLESLNASEEEIIQR